MEHFRETVIEFLVTTPIHGFRHLHVGKNLFEKIIWTIVLIVSFSVAIFMIRSSLKDAEENPILTTIETTNIAKVPFPAITISPRHAWRNWDFIEANPWSFVEKFVNQLHFYQDPFDPETFAKSKDIRERFQGLMDTVVEKMYEKLLELTQNWTLQEFTEWLEQMEHMEWRESIDFMATRLAVMSMNDLDQYQETTGKIKSILKQDFFRDDLMLDNLNELLENGDIDMTCNNTCDKHLIRGYKYAILPLQTTEFSELGLGTLLSMVAIIFHRPDYSDLPKKLRFHFTDKFNPEEEEVRQYLVEMFHRLMMESNDQDHDYPDISLYEFVPFINFDPRLSYSILDFIQARLGCDAQVYYTWITNWHQVYNGDKNFTAQMCPSPDDNCCKVIKKMAGLDLNILLKIFRFSIQAPNLIEGNDITSIYGNLSFLGSYSRLEDLEYYDRRHLRYNPNAKIISIKENGLDIGDDQFYHTLTHEGFGYSFNTANFWDIVKKTEFTKTFSNIMQPSGHESEPRMRYKDTSYELEMILYQGALSHHSRTSAIFL